MSAVAREILLTERDVVRLESLLDTVRRRAPEERGSAEALERRVDAARIVESRAIAPQVVTMNSVVSLIDCETRTTMQLALVYPQDAGTDRTRVSVLSPVGRALLGAHVGDAFRVTVPGERDRELLVAEIVYQPEANGRYDL